MPISQRIHGIAIVLVAMAAVWPKYPCYGRNGATALLSGKSLVEAGSLPGADVSGWTDMMPRDSLEGWTRVPIPPDKALDSVSQWKLDREHGMIVCGGDHGHEWLRYNHEFTNFLLHVEWRFEKREGMKGYNSGVFVRNDLTGRVWHQAQVGASAYLFGQTLIHGALSPITKSPSLGVEPLRPIGEWNTYEIRCDGPKITLWVNGVLTGEFAVPEVPKGYFGLEAEGYRIYFRNLKLKTLP
jgi:Domain of Unknown Function (DUF1080)